MFLLSDLDRTTDQLRSVQAQNLELEQQTREAMQSELSRRKEAASQRHVAEEQERAIQRLKRHMDEAQDQLARSQTMGKHTRVNALGRSQPLAQSLLLSQSAVGDHGQLGASLRY